MRGVDVRRSQAGKQAVGGTWILVGHWCLGEARVELHLIDNPK